MGLTEREREWTEHWPPQEWKDENQIPFYCLLGWKEYDEGSEEDTSCGCTPFSCWKTKKKQKKQIHFNIYSNILCGSPI